MMEHVSAERLADYLAGLLDDTENDEVEAHLFICRACATGSERPFAVAAAIRSTVPPVLSAARFGELEREGRIDFVNRMSPGEATEVKYPPPEKILVHRLVGSDLSGARRVDVALLDLEGRSVVRFEDVPFDAARGEVLLACQAHYADHFPPELEFRLHVVEGNQSEEAGRYTILHRAR